jgi:hypothetical protein
MKHSVPGMGPGLASPLVVMTVYFVVLSVISLLG